MPDIPQVAEGDKPLRRRRLRLLSALLMLFAPYL
jgi:hypothetical protein